MLPVLVDLQFIKIYTFGVFLVLAFFWGSFLLWKNTRLTSYKEEDIFDSFFAALFGAVFLGRLLYVALHFSAFGFDILKFILINGYPGLSLYGCLIGGIITFFLYSSFKKLDFLTVIDYCMAPLLIGLGIGKMGSFFSGVEVGSKTHFPVSLKYVNFDGARHLTAFYEALLFFIAALICHRLLFAIRRGRYWKGMTFYLFCWAFSLVYLVFDPLKANRVMVGGQSVNWVISLSLVLTFTLYFLYHLKDQIFSSTHIITNFFTKNAKHTITRVHKKTTKEVRTGTHKDSGSGEQTES